jgi:hypothetical protein
MQMLLNKMKETSLLIATQIAINLAIWSAAAVILVASISDIGSFALISDFRDVRLQLSQEGRPHQYYLLPKKISDNYYFYYSSNQLLTNKIIIVGEYIEFKKINPGSLILVDATNENYFEIYRTNSTFKLNPINWGFNKTHYLVFHLLISILMILLLTGPILIVNWIMKGSSIKIKAALNIISVFASIIVVYGYVYLPLTKMLFTSVFQDNILLTA